MTATGLVACKSWPFAATMLRKYAASVRAAMLDDDAAALVTDFAGYAAAIWHIFFVIKWRARLGAWRGGMDK